MYLVGAPDPYGELKPGEVYVGYPCDGLGGVQRDRSWNDRGDVVVTRNPCLHPGDVRKLVAVNNARLSDFLVGSSGGIIFFSIQGDRSDADCMGGGDFDGDLYLVLLSSNDMVQYVKPMDPHQHPSNGGSFSGDLKVTQNISWEIFRYLGDLGRQRLVGCYTNAWLALADHYGASDPRAIECCSIVYNALDAAKSGKRVSVNERFLEEPKPHYLEKRDSRTSTSLLGKLYDMVLHAEKDIQIDEGVDSFYLENGTLPLDSDLAFACFDDVIFRRWKLHLQTYKEKVVKVVEDQRSLEDAVSSLLDSYRKMYLAEAIKMVNEHPSVQPPGPMSREFNSLILLECLKTLASHIYQITYMNARRRRPTPGQDYCLFRYSVSFCWEVCGQYLHTIKFEAMLKRLNQNPNDKVLSSEMPFISSF